MSVPRDTQGLASSLLSWSEQTVVKGLISKLGEFPIVCHSHVTQIIVDHSAYSILSCSLAPSSTVPQVLALSTTVPRVLALSSTVPRALALSSTVQAHLSLSGTLPHSLSLSSTIPHSPSHPALSKTFLNFIFITNNELLWQNRFNFIFSKLDKYYNKKTIVKK
jgi:hypothetical protein